MDILQEEKKESLIARESSLAFSVFCGIGIMAVLIAIVYSFKVPNPNMILIAGLVVSSALFGYKGGIPAAVIMLAYSLFFFSEGNDFVTFTSQNSQKVIVTFIGVIVDMFFVCDLKRHEIEFFRKNQSLTERLIRDNVYLHQASREDYLTGINNRNALRGDYDKYLNHDVNVLMLDVDSFKQINDNHGHEKGDWVLTEMGNILSDLFGKENCYRYGGDEFLVIDISDNESFLEKIRLLESKTISYNYNGETVKVNFSGGYVCGKTRTNDDLRQLLKEADSMLLAAKRSGKKRILGVLQ